MKRIVLLTLATLLIGGCGFLPVQPTLPVPTAIPASPTTAPTDTPLPTATLPPATETFTFTPDPLFNSTATLPSDILTTTPATATGAAVSDTPTPVSFPSSITPTPTNGVLLYGTLPPAVPSAEVILRNRSEAEAYISLQNQAPNGAILEYPVDTPISIRVPLGKYFYVAWVGGNKMTGNFDIGRRETVTIVLFKDRVEIRK